MRARAKMTELRAQDLRFSPDECKAFLQNMLGIDVDNTAIAALEESTEGWAAGLRLTTLSLPQLGHVGEDSKLILAQRTNADNMFVTDYLVSEVLAQQTHNVQEFVLKTSILNRMCGPLCEAVVGINALGISGLAQLERIRAANLFVIPLARDGHAEWYRYHHTFRDFLHRHLELSSSREEIAELHRRASAWLAQNGLIEEALQHAIKAGDYTNAVRIFDLNRHMMLNEEHWHQLKRWLELFPREVRKTHPELVLTGGWLARANAHWEDMTKAIDQAGPLITQMLEQAQQSSDMAAAATARSLRGESDTLRSFLLLSSGDPSRALFHAQRALETLPFDHWNARLLARLYLAACFHYMGDDKHAYAAIYDGLTEASSNANTYRARLLVSASFLHLLSADLDGLTHAAQQGLALCEKRNNLESAYWAHHMIGIVHFYRNELAAAESQLGEVIAHRYLANAHCAVQSACALALIRQAQGDWDEARMMVDMAVDFALSINHPTVLAVARAFQAELAVRQGRLADAQRWMTQYTAPKMPRYWFFNAAITAARIKLAEDTVENGPDVDRQLTQLQAHAEATNDPLTLMDVLVLQSLLFEAQGKREDALKALTRALGMAQPGRFINLFTDMGPRMHLLLLEVHARGIATRFVEQILAAMAPATPAHSETSNRSEALAESLSIREIEVLNLLAQRLSNKEIAARLTISSGTVKRHVHNIYEKLGVSGRLAAVAKGRLLGLVSVPMQGGH
jgi:LuxR family maltose regulon positive regulatory protein